MRALKKLHSILTATQFPLHNSVLREEVDIFSDPRYVVQSLELIKGSLKNGSDILHMPNGDIFVTEVYTVVHKYHWDCSLGKLVKLKRKHKPSSKD